MNQRWTQVSFVTFVVNAFESRRTRSLTKESKKPEPGPGLPKELQCSYRLNAGAALCSATIFFALSAKALACGRSSRPLTTSGSDSARTFMPSS